MENKLGFWLKKLNCNQKELGKYLSVTEQQISNHWKYKGIPQKYIPQLEKLLSERQPNNNINNVEPNGAERNVSAAVYADNAIPLAQAEFKPIIPSELCEKLDFDLYDYLSNNLQSLRRSATIRQFADFSFFYEVMGDAMAPYYLPSDMIALKILSNPWKIENGRVYAIDTRGGVIVRMLYRDGDNFMARAFNPRFTELPIPAADVYDIYKVVGLVRRNI